MGLFTGLLTLPLAPVRGVAWVAEQIAEEADRQLYDERAIRRELLQLELDYDDGKVDEEGRREREADLLDRLAVSQARQGRLADAQPADDRSPEPVELTGEVLDDG